MAVQSILFKIKAPLGVTIHTTRGYWSIITNIKHPSMVKYKKEVKEALEDPDQIRKSKQDPRVHLYYRSIGKVFVCVVADHLSTKEGYIITSYLTDEIKEGEEIYVKD